MKQFRLYAIAFLLVLLFVSPALSTETSQTDQSAAFVIEQIDLMPLTFTENHGQWDDRVQFRANTGGATMWFTTDGVYYQFTRRTPVGQEPCAPDDLRGRQTSALVLSPEGSAPSYRLDSRERQMSTSAEQLVIKASFVDANPNPEIVGDNMMEYKCNYFIGNDPDKWHTDVPNYKAVVFKDVYSGIDLKYYGNGKQMEYDFIVSPDADPNQIMVRYDGAKSISVNDDGELVVETEWGNVTELRPLVYQFDANGCMPIDGQYVLFTDNTFGFDLGDRYDPTLALVIDPTLVYSTYLGGSLHDGGFSIAVDHSGYAYVTGLTYSSDFPIQEGYQTYQGDRDVFVTKLNISGDEPIYSTFLGGSGLDGGSSIVVDDSGFTYVTGKTYSSDFPIQGEYQSYHGLGDAFVTKLNSGGDGLIFSTYIGGSNYDWGRCVAVGESGCVYLTGGTLSSNFPLQGEFQAYQGDYDVFVTKLVHTGDELVYSTYLGGSGEDWGLGLALDNSEHAYVTGWTYSADFPVHGEYQTYQGDYDAFVTKLNISGDELVYSTYLGGIEADYGYGITVDGSGCAYIIGNTGSSDFPILGQYQDDQGGSDAFVTKLNNSGGGLTYSTYLGGSGDDGGRSIAIDGSGCAYVTGITGSSDFPIHEGFQTDQGGDDVFVTKLNSTGGELLNSTYLGGNAADHGYCVALDHLDHVFVTGRTGSSDFPVHGEYQTYQGDLDAFVTKLSMRAYECGDADAGGAIDIDDVVYLINFIFSGGPAPDPLASGDADCSGAVDIDDVVYLINYIFASGPAPCDPNDDGVPDC